MMAGISLSEALALDTDAGREKMFEDRAGYVESAPAGSRYQVRVGAKFLRSDDTRDLRKKFDREVARLRRMSGA